MIDETINTFIEKLTSANEMIRNYICYQCKNKDSLYGCCGCFNCERFEAKEREQ